jgi:hypothetical protein
MGKHIAAFYSPDNDLEHALSFSKEGLRSDSTFGVYDITFSPQTQSHGRGVMQINVIQPPSSVAVAGAYSPVDGLRYAFIATTDNQIYVSTYPQEGNDIFQFPAARVYDTPFPSYPPNSIVDIAAFFSLDSNPAVSNQIYVAVLMANGDLWEVFGTPDTIGSWTAIGLLFAHAPHGKSICAYYSPQDQQRHLLIATDHDITHVYTTSHSTHQDTFAHFDQTIIAISGFYTPDDQMQHAIIATTDSASSSFQAGDDLESRDRQEVQRAIGPRGGGGAGYYLQEIVFQLGSPIPPPGLLGMLPFTLVDVGAYVKSDGGRHVILFDGTTQLYLGSYSPGGQGFVYNAWPTPKLWPSVPPKIESFTAQPDHVNSGDTVTLSWKYTIAPYEGPAATPTAYWTNITGKDLATGMRVYYNSMQYAAQGSVNVQPMSTTIYILTASFQGIDDPNWVNSTQQLQVTVTPKQPPTPANLVVTNTYYTDESGNALPPLYANDPFIAHFIVGNAGGTATGPFKVTMVRDNNVQSVTVSVTNLTPSQVTDVSWNFSSGLPSGSYEIVATVDPEGVVKEPPGPRVSTLGIIIDSR